MSRIEWTDITWNPVTGCTKVSPGCDHCYAEAMTRRFASRWGDFETVRLHQDRLLQPLKWSKGQRVFVCSMADLFHKAVPDSYLDTVFAAMALASRDLTFQVLTKRSSRMRDYVKGIYSGKRHLCSAAAYELDLGMAGGLGCSNALKARPMNGIWLGVSVEDRKRKIRIEHLRQTLAEVRFLSCEPLLEDLGELDLTGIDWVIVGGESGPRARPMLASWADRILHQCRAAGVPFFLKQMGSVWTHGRGNGGGPEDIPEHLLVREFPR